MKIAASSYSAAVCSKGKLYVWGSSSFGSHRAPTVFSKLTKKFVDVVLSQEAGYALTDDG
mgnify:CR=1 FL=1